jgi:hypothetical protein
MSTLIKTTADGRKVEVIGQAVCLDGKQEATALVSVREHPNRAAILQAVPDATHMAGRLPLTMEQAALAQAALDEAKQAYDNSPTGISERIRLSIKDALSKMD